MKRLLLGSVLACSGLLARGDVVVDGKVVLKGKVPSELEVKEMLKKRKPHPQPLSNREGR